MGTSVGPDAKATKLEPLNSVAAAQPTMADSVIFLLGAAFNVQVMQASVATLLPDETVEDVEAIKETNSPPLMVPALHDMNDRQVPARILSSI